MTKKKEREYGSLEEEVLALRRQVAGLKSYNNAIASVKKDLEQSVSEFASANEKLKREKRENEEYVLKLNEELSKVRDEKFVLESEIEYYNGLPWYKRIFARLK